MADQFDRLLRGRKADSGERLRGERFEAFERKREMRAALVVGDGVDFVHDHGANGAQQFPALSRREQNVERFRRGDQNVRRALLHREAVVDERVAGAHGGANFGHQEAALVGQLENFSQRDVQILLNVVAQRFQRRNVQDFGLIEQVAGERFAHQHVNAGEKCGERLAGTGGRADQVFFPARMCGQPSSCGSVGVPNLATNHSRTSGCAHSRDLHSGASGIAAWFIFLFLQYVFRTEGPLGILLE